MALQLYYTQNLQVGINNLPSELSHHLANVLRIKADENILLTNGLGIYATAKIIAVSKKNVSAQITEIANATTPQSTVNIAIAFTKNASRMEWLLEKITEIGVHNIYPILTARSEKVFFKQERFQKILESAMCQSMQYYLPVLHQPISLQALLPTLKFEQKFIAHCIDADNKYTLQKAIKKEGSSLIFIGPEGDFTVQEIESCIASNCIPVSLGNTRLRTETAGLVAVTLLNTFVSE